MLLSRVCSVAMVANPHPKPLSGLCHSPSPVRGSRKDLTAAGGKNGPVFQDHVDKTQAFEMRHPHPLTSATI